MPEVESNARPTSRRTFADSRWTIRFAWAVAILATGVGVGWRMIDLTEWPFPLFQPVQYESALASRSIWMSIDSDARTAERLELFREDRFRHVVSPPILPALAAVSYRIAGDEIPWISKVFAAGFWLVAAWSLRAATRNLTGSSWAGVAALTYLLMAPFGLIVSRCFQTESVAVCGLAIGVWQLSRSGSLGDRRAVILSGIICGVLGLAKPGTLFLPLTGGVAGLLALSGGRPVTKLSYFAIFTILHAIPSVLYGAIFLSDRGGEIQPHRLLEMDFYVAVERMLATTIRWPALAVGLGGAILALGRKHGLALGLFVGFGGFFGVFTFHATTHEYYYTTLLVPVALGLGCAVAFSIRLGTGLFGSSRRNDALLAAAVLFGLTRFAVVSTTPWVGPWRLSSGNAAGLAGHYEKEAAFARSAKQTRAIVRPGARVVVLADALAFEYWANIRVSQWPRNSDLAFLRSNGTELSGMMEQMIASAVAQGIEYFVVCELDEFRAQPELRAAIDTRGRCIFSTPDLLIFELR